MIVHGQTLISEDVLEKDFVCNLSACHGECCVEGESGAPLEQEDINAIEKNLEAIKPFMTPEGKALLQKKGFYERDSDGDLVTQCLNGKACIFATQENGIYQCAVEKAFLAGKTAYKKPVSCHLYPIRLEPVGSYTGVNYSKWKICNPACLLGAELQVPVYRFLKEALTRRFGEKWYTELEEIAAEFKATKA